MTKRVVDGMSSENDWQEMQFVSSKGAKSERSIREETVRPCLQTTHTSIKDSRRSTSRTTTSTLLAEHRFSSFSLSLSGIIVLRGVGQRHLSFSPDRLEMDNVLVQFDDLDDGFLRLLIRSGTSFTECHSLSRFDCFTRMTQHHQMDKQLQGWWTNPFIEVDHHRQLTNDDNVNENRSHSSFSFVPSRHRWSLTLGIFDQWSALICDWMSSVSENNTKTVLDLIWSDLEQCPNERWNSEKETNSMICDENYRSDEEKDKDKDLFLHCFIAINENLLNVEILFLQAEKCSSSISFQLDEKCLHQWWRERKWSFHPREKSPCCSSDLNRSVWRTFTHQKDQIDNEIPLDDLWRNCFSVVSPQLVIGSVIAHQLFSHPLLHWKCNVLLFPMDYCQSSRSCLLDEWNSFSVFLRCPSFHRSLDRSWRSQWEEFLLSILSVNRFFECSAKNSSKQIQLPCDLAENEVQISLDRNLFQWAIFSLISSIITKERCDRLGQLLVIVVDPSASLSVTWPRELSRGELRNVTPRLHRCLEEQFLLEESPLIEAIGRE